LRDGEHSAWGGFASPSARTREARAGVRGRGGGAVAGEAGALLVEEFRDAARDAEAADGVRVALQHSPAARDHTDHTVGEVTDEGVDEDPAGVARFAGEPAEFEGTGRFLGDVLDVPDGLGGLGLPRAGHGCGQRLGDRLRVVGPTVPVPGLPLAVRVAVRHRIPRRIGRGSGRGRGGEQVLGLRTPCPRR
jgi:hypothetical protein